MNQHLDQQSIRDIAEDFWGNAGGRTRWPCDIKQAIALLLPLDTVHLSCLTIKRIESWLYQRNVHYRFPQVELRLHGCLLAYRGAGFVFIDGTDDQRERFYTLAHEVAHFLIDYMMPRKNALAIFGQPILEVLDGIRLPTREEKIDNIINSIDIQPFIHLLEHNTVDSSVHVKIWRAEDQADRLALELIAPFQSVCKDLKRSEETISFEQCHLKALELLGKKYGLPASIVKRYAYFVAQKITGGSSVLSSLGLD